MCGICGIISFSPNSDSTSSVEKMMYAMKHRGPDDDGIFLMDNVGFGFVRLSIIDLSNNGHQPMTSVDGNLTIVFNGEIYNYIELKEELKNYYEFKTKSDTEVILASFSKWGIACLNKFQGMWAFAIYDQITKEVIIARDRFGIKPIHICRIQDTIFFASEIKALYKTLKIDFNPNETSIFNYLTDQKNEDSQSTFFKEIHKIPPGHYLSIRDRKVNLIKWYEIESSNQEPFTSSDEFREILFSSIANHLRSDVPIGTCLSGGLDSSGIVASLLHKYKINGINTFSAIYPESPEIDESKFIKLFENELQNMHYVTPTIDGLISELPLFLEAQSEPVRSTSIYAQYKVMELASKNVKVLLDGQGADEQLGGYGYFHAFYQLDLLKKFRINEFSNEFYKTVIKRNNYNLIYTILFLSLPMKLKTYFQNMKYDFLNFSTYRSNDLFSQNSTNLSRCRTFKDALINHLKYRLEDLLKWEDLNSMNFSIESRVPFLNHILVEKSIASSTLLIKNGISKNIYRKSMEGIIPCKILERTDKLGFNTPQSFWFRNSKFQNYLVSILNKENLLCHTYIDKAKLKNILYKQIHNQQDNNFFIWKALNLELWLDSHFNSRKKY